MKDKSSQEGYIIYRDKRGNIDIAMIFAALTIFLLLPAFVFFAEIFYEKSLCREIKGYLEISAINTYGQISNESLGYGVLHIDKEKSEEFYINELNRQMSGNEHIQIIDTYVEINNDGKRVKIFSFAIAQGSFMEPRKIISETEYIIDPVTEE